jgi:NTP pyrophosphatase (non-canonical NTP hydrolase)
MDFTDYQSRALETDQTQAASPDEARLIPLLGLAGEAGQLLSDYKKRLRDGPSHEQFVDHVAEELGDLLWYVANVASKFGLELENIAQSNLEKTRRRYVAIQRVPSLDAAFGEGERFPRQFDVNFTEMVSDNRAEVRISIDGVAVGSALTDNAYKDDGYRFHDVFHIAYAAVLGWSPVLRSLIRRKRRSNAVVDEVEDGGRAAVIEEGIAALVFDYARSHAFLEGVTDIDKSLLRTIQGMSAHLEVASQPANLWRKAILEGFVAWRKVVANHGGRLAADLDEHTLTYLHPVEMATATAAAALSE